MILFKLRLTIIVLIVVLTVGSTIIFLGFLSNQNYVGISEISNQYEKLKKYQDELEKINLYNEKILKNLEERIQNSDAVNIDQINEEINIIKQVINENKVELEDIIQKLSQMESDT